jgi:hypothetical protein
MGGGMYGGGYGGGTYGGMGMGAMGGMGMGMGMGGGYGGMGMPGDPNNPQSLTQSFSQSTQATFHMIESIVGAFGGFAQMLESTYMATHSSFFGGYIHLYMADTALTFSCSHGISSRAVWQLTTNIRLCARHLYNNAMDTDSDREAHRKACARVVERLDARKLRRLLWTTTRWIPFTKAVPETFHHVHAGSVWPTLSHG